MTKLLTVAGVLLCVSVYLAAQAPSSRPEAVQQMPLPPSVSAQRDIPYSDASKRLLLDVYAPTGAKEGLPAVVWIHGGGWQKGDKTACPPIMMIPRGFVAVSINYRLTNEATWPAQIQDCKAAIRFLRANAEKYHIDPNRIGVWGASAGGHLAAMLGVCGEDNTFDVGPNLDCSSKVQAVCDFFGPTDFLGSGFDPKAFPPGAKSPLTRLLGGTPEEKKEVAISASPARRVTKNNPPFLICHGDEDHLVPLAQSQSLEKELKNAGTDVTLFVAKGGSHGKLGKGVNKLVVEFFQKHLTPQPASTPSKP